MYQSHLPLLKKVTLISVNDLADTDYNAWLRCFASKKTEKKKAFRRLNVTQLSQDKTELCRFVEGLFNLMLGQLGEHAMKYEVIPEDIAHIGKFFEGTEFEKGIIKRKMREELTLEERLEGLSPEERLNGLSPEDRLGGLSPEDFLKTLSPEAIEAYLQKIKQTNQSS